MIPIGDAQRRFGFPWMTVLLLLVCLAMFLYEHTLTPAQWETLASRYALVSRTVDQTAASGVPDSTMWNTLTYLFFQGQSWLEPLINLAYLWALGKKVEDACGPWGFSLLCFLCAVGGAVTKGIATPLETAPVSGLAGVVAGLMGAYFVLYEMRPIRAWLPPFILIPIPAFLHLLYWGGLEFVNLHVGALRSMQWNRVITLEATWPLLGGLVVGLLAAQLFSRQEFLYYRILRAERSA